MYFIRHTASAEDKGVYGKGRSSLPSILALEGINDELEVGILVLTSAIQANVGIQHHNVSKEDPAFQEWQKLQLGIDKSAPEHGMSQSIVQRHIMKCHGIEEPQLHISNLHFRL